eukprot:scaffold21722_cov16-Tisochrysis_lutea.AAC.1
MTPKILFDFWNRKQAFSEQELHATHALLHSFKLQLGRLKTAHSDCLRNIRKLASSLVAHALCPCLIILQI